MRLSVGWILLCLCDPRHRRGAAALAAPAAAGGGGSNGTADVWCSLEAVALVAHHKTGTIVSRDAQRLLARDPALAAACDGGGGSPYVLKLDRPDRNFVEVRRHRWSARSLHRRRRRPLDHRRRTTTTCAVRPRARAR